MNNAPLSPFNEEYFMKQALIEAQKAFDRDEVPIGAVIVANNQIIARSHNLTECLNDVTAHAEMQAITSAAGTIGGKYLTDCAIYVTVEPCVMCAGALYWSQIAHVYIGATDEKRGSLRFEGLFHPKTKIHTGLMEAECKTLMQAFFQNKR